MAPAHSADFTTLSRAAGMWRHVLQLRVLGLVLPSHLRLSPVPPALITCPTRTYHCPLLPPDPHRILSHPTCKLFPFPPA